MENHSKYGIHDNYYPKSYIEIIPGRNSNIHISYCNWNGKKHHTNISK